MTDSVTPNDESEEEESPEIDEVLSVSGSTDTAVIEELNNPLFFGMSTCGTFIVGFALVLLWCNERKKVKHAQFITEARKECRSIDAYQPFDTDDYWLVHAKGVIENREDIVDVAFGVSAANSYRLVRKVEMLQWVERMTSTVVNGEKAQTFSYEKEWHCRPIDSSTFAKKD